MVMGAAIRYKTRAHILFAVSPCHLLPIDDLTLDPMVQPRQRHRENSHITLEGHWERVE